MDSLDSRFNEMQHCEFSRKQTFRGIWLIARTQNLSTYLRLLWEIFTAIVVYSPGISTFSQDFITSIRSKWNSYSHQDQVCVIAALSYLNKNGRIDRVLHQYNK